MVFRMEVSLVCILFGMVCRCTVQDFVGDGVYFVSVLPDL